MVNIDFSLNIILLKQEKPNQARLVSLHPIPLSRIEMSKDALPEKACQLDSRYWRITNAKGDVEEVQGPGVVGMYVTQDLLYRSVAYKTFWRAYM